VIKRILHHRGLAKNANHLSVAAALAKCIWSTATCEASGYVRPWAPDSAATDVKANKTPSSMRSI
jgi:hypothetical protein